MKPQTNKVLRHLQSGGSITPLEALNQFGIFRLGARIYELRRAGIDVAERRVKGPNGARFSRYELQRA